MPFITLFIIMLLTVSINSIISIPKNVLRHSSPLVTSPTNHDNAVLNHTAVVILNKNTVNNKLQAIFVLLTNFVFKLLISDHRSPCHISFEF